MYGHFYQSPIGMLYIEVENAAITRIHFNNEAEKIKKEQHTAAHNGSKEQANKLVAQKAADQLHEYFNGKLKNFNLTLNPAGTAYMRKIWGLLQTIPYGKTATYGEIAALAGNAKAARAVGLANHRNPIPIIIPCHRVIGASGKLTGYAGGLDIKTTLLKVEGLLITK